MRLQIQGFVDGGEMANEKQRKTFISYSRVNKEFAVKLAKELRSSGFSIWLDQLDIPTGARWDDEIEKALEESQIFMVILTPASSTSENVKDEIGYAIDSGKHILPVLLENAKVPLRLRRFQYVDFTSKSYEDGVESAKQLLRALNEEPTLPRIEVPTADQIESAKEGQASEKTPSKAESQTPDKSKDVQPARAIPEKKPLPAAPAPKPAAKGLYFGIGAIVLLILAGIGFSMFSKGGSTPTPAPAATNPPTVAPTVEVVNTPTIVPSVAPTTPAVDVESLIPKANILVYEDTGGDAGLLVEPMLKKVGYATHAKFVHDRLLDFKSALTAPDEKWDLIIIAAESHSAVSGEFWGYIKDQLDAGTGVIVETWSIHKQSSGQIKSILDGCGVQLQKTLDLAVPIKWYVSDNPLFNTPKQVSELSTVTRHWSAEAADLVKLTAGSKATVLAGTSSSLQDSGVITSCYDGRMILQTFSNHDYPIDQINALWQNYVYNTLKNHFLKTTQ
jgi:hypothetical protein